VQAHINKLLRNAVDRQWCRKHGKSLPPPKLPRVVLVSSDGFQCAPRPGRPACWGTTASALQHCYVSVLQQQRASSPVPRQCADTLQQLYAFDLCSVLSRSGLPWWMMMGAGHWSTMSSWEHCRCGWLRLGLQCGNGVKLYTMYNFKLQLRSLDSDIGAD
jgi:hypothetical protein